MAIYPIIDGQKLDQRNSIPPLGESQSPHQASGDLVDFGQEPPSAQSSLSNEFGDKLIISDSSDIPELLSQTGTPATAGPLIDLNAQADATSPK